MLLYRHHTAVDVIDLDDETGLWVPVEKNKDGPIRVGQMPMAMRADFLIRGSYVIEHDKRYYFYWNDKSELIFKSDDERFCLIRRESDGGLIDLAPDLAVDLQPATYGDGRARPNMSTFTLSDPVSTRSVEVLYDSERYLQYYLGNFTFVPDEDLSDWDFFVHVKRTLEELKLLACARIAASATSNKEFVRSEALVTVSTGQAASRAGSWAAIHHLDRRCWLDKGESAPDVDGLKETWLWVAE